MYVGVKATLGMISLGDVLKYVGCLQQFFHSIMRVLHVWIELDMYERMHKACVENNAQLSVCRYASEYKDKTVLGGKDKTLPLTREELLKIRRHEMKYEEVKELMLKTEAQMKEAFEVSTLPDEPDQRLLEDLLIQIRESVYDNRSNYSDINRG